jgi:hypothetical protein
MSSPFSHSSVCLPHASSSSLSGSPSPSPTPVGCAGSSGNAHARMALLRSATESRVALCLACSHIFATQAGRLARSMSAVAMHTSRSAVLTSLASLFVTVSCGSPFSRSRMPASRAEVCPGRTSANATRARAQPRRLASVPCPRYAVLAKTAASASASPTSARVTRKEDGLGGGHP